MAGSEPGETKSGLQVAVWSSLASAFASIAVAFIGIVPELRKEDKEALEALRTINGVIDSAPEARLTIRGTVSGAGESKVYLVPGNRNNYLTVTDASGDFRFDNLFPGPYWILVQSETNGVTRWLISPGDAGGTRASGGATLEYRVETPGKAPTRTANGSR